MKASSDKPTVPRKQLEAMTNFILKWDGQTPIENDKDLAKLLEDKACFEAFVATVEMIHGPIGMELNLLRKNESSSQEEENHDKI